MISRTRGHALDYIIISVIVGCEILFTDVGILCNKVISS